MYNPFSSNPHLAPKQLVSMLSSHYRVIRSTAQRCLIWGPPKVFSMLPKAVSQFTCRSAATRFTRQKRRTFDAQIYRQIRASSDLDILTVEWGAPFDSFQSGALRTQHHCSSPEKLSGSLMHSFQSIFSLMIHDVLSLDLWCTLCSSTLEAIYPRVSNT